VIPRRQRIGFVLTGLGVLAAVFIGFDERAGGSPRQSAAAPRGCSVVRFAQPIGNGMTGGTSLWWITMRNVGSSPCIVQGHPWLRVPAERYPVKIEELRPGDDFAGSGTALRVAPSQAVRVAVIVAPGTCDRARGKVSTVTLDVGWGVRSVEIRGTACLRSGPIVAVGSFQR
jgi:hypothetical protein